MPFISGTSGFSPNHCDLLSNLINPIEPQISEITQLVFDQTLSEALSQAAARGAKGAGREVKIFRISEMDFEPYLHNGHHTAQTLEADIVAFQEALTWADTLVLVHPLWWGGPPAKLKALFDRALLPDFAFVFLPGKSTHEKLLTGKAAHLILTSDSPAWYLKWLAHGWVKTLNQQVLGYRGFSKTRVTYIGPVRTMDEEARKKKQAKPHHHGSNSPHLAVSSEGATIYSGSDLGM